MHVRIDEIHFNGLVKRKKKLQVLTEFDFRIAEDRMEKEEIKHGLEIILVGFLDASIKKWEVIVRKNGLIVMPLGFLGVVKESEM